jgi:putative hydrolase of the HAD superfamily
VKPYSHLLLDLDDTLYPNNSGVWEAVRNRIQAYIEQKLSIAPEDASVLRQRYLEQYGTTMTGLKNEFDIDIEDYLDYVHDIPIPSLLSPNPELRTMLKSIHIPRIIFTNAYRPHAERVLNCLGVQDEIDQIIDIYALEFHNKPKDEAYLRALALIAAKDPARVVFVDDRLSNLEPAAKLRIKTILVGPEQGADSHLHIEHITALTKILPGLSNHQTGVSDA